MDVKISISYRALCLRHFIPIALPSSKLRFQFFCSTFSCSSLAILFASLPPPPCGSVGLASLRWGEGERAGAGVQPLRHQGVRQHQDRRREVRGRRPGGRRKRGGGGGVYSELRKWVWLGGGIDERTMVDQDDPRGGVVNRIRTPPSSLKSWRPEPSTPCSSRSALCTAIRAPGEFLNGRFLSNGGREFQRNVAGENTGMTSLN